MPIEAYIVPLTRDQLSTWSYYAEIDPIAVASRENTPSEILTELAGDLRQPDNDIREAINPVLAASIKRELLNNPNTPPLVKVWLHSDFGMSLEEFLKVSQL